MGAQLQEGSVTQGSAAQGPSDKRVHLYGGSVTVVQLLGVQVHGGSVAIETETMNCFRCVNI